MNSQTLISLIEQDTRKGRTQVIYDSFVDYKGETHEFLIAAVSVPTIALCEEWQDEDDSYYEDPEHSTYSNKVLSLGIAICNPCDKWNDRIAYQMATGRARKFRDNAIYVTHDGLINTGMVTALLQQEANYVKHNPEKYIKGYIEQKLRWEKQNNVAKNSTLA